MKRIQGRQQKLGGAARNCSESEPYMESSAVIVGLSGGEQSDGGGANPHR